MKDGINEKFVDPDNPADITPSRVANTLNQVIEDKVEKAVEDKYATLLELISKSNLTVGQIKSMIAGSKRTRYVGPKPSPVIHITEVTKNYTCVFCGSRHTSIIKLNEGDTLDTTNKDGRTEHIYAKKGSEPVVIECWLRTCGRCENKLHTLSHTTLVGLALMLLKHHPLPYENKHM